MHKKYNNMRMKSFLANTSSRPYFQWVAVVDPSTCNRCLALDKRVFHFTDPIWVLHMPPIHKGCRCRFRAFEEADLLERGLKVSSSFGLF